MRLTLHKNYSKEFNPPDIKYGRGGFQELELLVQMGMLLMNIGYKKNHQSPKKLKTTLSPWDQITYLIIQILKIYQITLGE